MWQRDFCFWVKQETSSGIVSGCANHQECISARFYGWKKQPSLMASCVYKKWLNYVARGFEETQVLQLLESIWKLMALVFMTYWAHFGLFEVCIFNMEKIKFQVVKRKWYFCVIILFLAELSSKHESLNDLEFKFSTSALILIHVNSYSPFCVWKWWPHT